MELPLGPLPVDVFVHHVVRNLNVQDLGRLSQCSRSLFEHLLCDAAWEHIRERCVRAVPFWQPLVFECFPWKNGEEERPRKRATVRTSQARTRTFTLPAGGTRYALKTYVGKARNATTVRAMVNSRRESFDGVRCRVLDKAHWRIEGAVLRRRATPVSRHTFGLSPAHERTMARCAVIMGAVRIMLPDKYSLRVIPFNNAFDVFANDEVVLWLQPKLNIFVRRDRPFAAPVRETRPHGFADLFWFNT